MSFRSLTWRRAGVGTVAAVTLAAGMPLLVGTASAAPATRLDLKQDDGRTSAAAGTCTAFTATPVDAFGGNANAATVTVVLTESPVSDTHDVDFCVVDGGTPFRTAPEYRNAGDPGSTPLPVDDTDPTTQQYDAGPSITTAASDSPDTNGAAVGPGEASPDNPDAPSGANSTTNNNNNNPTGRDTASFATTNGGTVVFGVVGLAPGSRALVDAFVDNDGDRVRDTAPSTDPTTTRDDPDTVQAPQRSLTFTAGGRPGTPAAADAVTRVLLTPEESFEAKILAESAATHSFRATTFNSAGDRVGGVTTLDILATSGPNTTTTPDSSDFCSETGNEGEPATCTYTAQTAGTDTVAAYVNQTTNNPTGLGLDTSEPRDTSTAVTTSPPVAAGEARRLVLTPESAAVTAGSSREFAATVTDVNGTPAQGVVVAFDESGPGTLTGGTATTAGPREVVTDATGRAVVTLTTSVGESGSNTIASAIKNPSATKCQQPASGSTPAGQCGDTSTVTVTGASASASPSPSASASPSATPSVTASPTPSQTSTPPATADGSRYRGLGSPERVLDTRDNRGVRRQGEIQLDLSQRISDPNATSAVLNVTVTNATRRGFLVAYPTGTTKPGTSNVNFEANQTQANEVVVRLGADRRVSLFVDSASAHVIADLVGSFTTSVGSGVGEITTNAPRRAFDSRNTGTPVRTGEVTVDLSGSLPAGATDAVLNVTVTRTSARGFVTVFPTGTTRPGTSNVNFERGQTQANEVITRVGTGANAGTVSFFVDSANASLIVDVVGAVTPGTGAQAFTALSSPQRALDTRDNRGTRRSGNVDLTLPSSIPADATGVILNVTATNGTRPGFVTVFPAGQANPGTSNVNFPTNLTQANEVTTALGDGNRVTLFVGGGGGPSAHVIVDVVGYLR